MKQQQLSLLLKRITYLKNISLTKWQLQHKEYLSNWYGTHLHEGLFLDPVMRDFEAFLESSQKNVSGDVHGDSSTLSFCIRWCYLPKMI